MSSNPLAIDLKKQLGRLQELCTGSGSQPHLRALQNASSRATFLTTLSGALLEPSLTTTIAHAFRPILIDLCSRWLDNRDLVEEKFEALCLLVQMHEELFPILSSFLRDNITEEGPLAFVLSAPSALDVDTKRLHRMLLAYYRILEANGELPLLYAWPLEPLSALAWAPHPDPAVRFMAVRCYALQSGMGEGERERMEMEVVGRIDEVDCPLYAGLEASEKEIIIDAWVVAATEARRVHAEREAIGADDTDFYGAQEPILQSELSSSVVDIHGVLMFRQPGGPFHSTGLIPTLTSIAALQSLALHISLSVPTLLTSAPSAGKSLFLSHLAAVLHPGVSNQIVTLPLADTSLDPRALLGSYISSPTKPGTFEWREGVLVRAMRAGRWLVLEDIDKGSAEVLGTLAPLAASLAPGVRAIGGRARLNIPGREVVIAEESFRLFATRSMPSTRNGSFPKPVFFAAHKFTELTIGTPDVDELQTIVDARFPRLRGAAATGAIALWAAMKDLGSGGAGARPIGLRELDKVCSRLSSVLPTSFQAMDMDTDAQAPYLLSLVFTNPSLREDIFLEARDVFFGAGSTTTTARAHGDAMAALAAEHLALAPETRDALLHTRAAEFTVDRDANGNATAVRAGRVRLPAAPLRAELLQLQTPQRPFAMHRPARALLARIGAAITLAEPVLLTGETGTGKTSAVTHLAGLLRRNLVSLNLSQQSEGADLVGGFKPVEARIMGGEIGERWTGLFRATFSSKKNPRFEGDVQKGMREGKWKRVVGLWRESTRIAKERITGKMAKGDEKDELDSQAPRKRRKTDGLAESLEKWIALEEDVTRFEVQHVQGKGKFAFSFVEGPLVKALRSGDWILLDEINLASPETLEAVSGLLSGPTASITLTEQGSLEPVPRHPDFRLFACMNPATDVGKKDLPPHIRSRFTEIDVPPPDADRETLLSIVAQYIGGVALGDKAAILDVAEFYSSTKALAESRQLADGANHRPHFSMRTLARALSFAADIAPLYSLRRALWEGCLMAFTMALDAQSAKAVTALAEKHILHGVKNVRSLLKKEPPPPAGRSAEEFVKFGPFYLERGPLPLDAAEDYIITPSVSQKLIDLSRIVSSRRYPVLIEGPTSAGKTSAIEYLARRTGHRFVRINNHEHTDIQEYLGTYVSDPATGALVWRDGLLVQALRQGDWLVLDELNLAPTDVLEALNRLLDDNRELVLPATGEVLRPHPSFVLFATQNPPGLYAGRKVLSRAFRNRFLEVHFADVPQAELERILCERARIAPSYATKIVIVFQELQKRRQAGRVFESKHAFATLRDLFRWAGRDAVGYQELAENGYMLLAERARRADDRAVVQEVIEEVMRPVKIDPRALYDLEAAQFAERIGFAMPSSTDLVWTSAMRRLLVLLGRALRFDEPVLLVGETGTGKTSVVQVFADAVGRELFQLSCHQNTETADLIGGLRPVRNRAAIETEAIQEATEVLVAAGMTVEQTDLSASLDRLAKQTQDPALALRAANARGKLARLGAIFEWHDGPLVTALRSGSVFLLDEISLADDSVLERLNSVLESARTVVLAERAGGESVTAAQGFKLVATMNPGGDYGKKELSPALRNRFTEIWVPAVEYRADLEGIVNGRWAHEALRPYTAPLLDFCEWLGTKVNERNLLGLRDILAWVSFSNSVLNSPTLLVCLDGLGSLPVLSSYTSDALAKIKTEATMKLQELVPLSDVAQEEAPIAESESAIRLGLFAIHRGPLPQTLHAYNIEAPTTRDNAMRVARACQLPKPILLEGSPGVGKTSLIVALAKLCGHHLCRINLSDQTDLADLFGTDLPVEGGKPGEFAWKDAEFLIAMQQGHWVLLDEMNLAPQSVLEGLNAVLDHRGTVFIPELGRSFSKHPSFRIFAAQNPIAQGGGRKGLPKSYVNRFTKVYVEALTAQDLHLIGHHLFPDYPEDLLHAMIDFNSRLQEEIAVKHSFGRAGSPWEFNLRDIARWGSVLRSQDCSLHPIEHLRSIYLSRFRSEADRSAACALFSAAFGISADKALHAPHYVVAPELVQVGHYVAHRANFSLGSHPQLLQSHLAAVETMSIALEQQWLVIVTGPRESGKTNVVRLMADLAGAALHEVSINNSTDTTDILGSFEQVDGSARARGVIRRILSLVDAQLRSADGSRARLSQTRELWRLVASSNPIDSTSLQMALSLLEQIPGVDNSIKDTLCSSAEALATTTTTEGRFEWVDGPLVRALKEGHWLLLDNANLCNPSVLDRLNALCEPGGVLTLNEQGIVNGAVPVIAPHPNFRLVMCVDPQHGELSRAMRNRGIEVYISLDRTAEDISRLQVSHRLPKDASPDPVAFEARRRGFTSPLSAADPNWPSGRLVGDSITSYNKDLVAVLSASHSPLALSSLLFLTRSLLTSRSAAFLRLLACEPSAGDLRPLLQLMNMLASDGRWSKIEAIRQAFAPIWPVSSDLLRVEPADFFAKFAVSSPTYPHFADVAMQHSLLRAIDIVVRSIAQEIASPDGLVVPDASPVQSAQDKLLRDVLIGVNTIDQAVRTLSVAFFSDTTLNLSTMSSTGVDALHSLQKMVAFLLQSTHGDVNLSAIQTIAKWLSATMKDAPSSFGEVDSAVGALGRLVTPSTGLGLTDIWSAMRGPALPRIVLTLADSLRLSPDVRRELVNLYAMAGLPGTASERSAIASAIEAVHARLASLSSEALERENHATQASAIAVKQLDAVIRVRLGGASTDATAVESFLALAYAHSHIDVQSLVSYRTAAWSLKEDRLTVAAASAAVKSWHEALWASDTPGPALLVRPTELMALFATCDWQTVALDALRDFESGLGRQAGLLTFGDSKPRSDKIALLYRNTILLIVCCFSESLDASVQRELLGASSWTQLRGLLAATSHPGLSAALDALMTSVNNVLSTSSSQTQSSVLSRLGHEFIRLFYVFVGLYVPDTPLDPAVAQQCEDAYWSTESDGLSAQLALHAEFERRTTSNSSNGVMEYLGTDLDVARRHLRIGGENDTPASRPVARLREYWLEVSQFLSGVVSAQKIDQIVALAEVDAATAVSRESVVQDSIRGFMQRMRSVYGDFQDIDGPLQFALLQLRFGLRLAMSAAAVNDASEVSALARDLVSLPTISVISPLVSRSAADLHTANVAAYDYLLLQLTGITADYDTGADVHSHIGSLDIIFEQAVRLTLIDQARQEEADAAGQSLYRSKAIESETINDSEIEMEEFLALFPDYENVLAEESDVDKLVSSLPSASHTGSARNQALAEAFMHLFASSGARRRVDPTARFVQLRKAAAQQLLSAHGDALPDALDIQSHGFSLAMLHHRLQSITHRTHSFGKAYDFYLDANVPEVRKATLVVQAMARRLRVIITEWPEQMVLQHLLARCEQVLRLNIHSPVAKVLAAIEQLLVQSEDWEMYANRENTLKEHRDALTALIVEWRRLELASWQGLLERQEAAFQDAVSEWWSRIYNACIRGLFDIVESEGDLDKFLDELVPLVENFVTSSPLGQYERRLDMLLGFERWIKMLAQKKSAAEAAALSRVFRVIASTRAYYSQFVPQVVASLLTQRNALEKNIKDFIKLASWRDVNVQSLKASAKRTHIQLYKSIRKFRDILRQPVLPLLRAEHASGNSLSIKFADYTASTPAAVFTVTDTLNTSAPAHLQNLSRTYERFSTLIISRVDTFLGSSPHSALRELAHEVITTANDLANGPLPTEGPAERRGKLAKALLVRKRKAWSDLLKELKRIGMAYNVQPQVLEQQRSARWLREQPVVPSTDNAVADVALMDTYYMRLLGLLPQLRSSLSSHNEDIQTRELLRGVNLLESGLAFALDARSRLADGLNSYATLHALVERLQSFEGTRQIATSGSDLQRDLQRQHDDLGRLAHALAESTELCNMLCDLPSTASAPADLLVELTSLRAESLGLRDQLSGICSRMPASATPIVLLDEYEVATAGSELVKRVNLRLREWTVKEPRVERILTPVREWAETLATPLSAIRAPIPTQDSLDTIIDSLLVTIQALIAAVPEPKTDESDRDDDNYVKSTNALFARLTSLLHIDAVSQKLVAAFDKIATCSQEDLARIVPRILPFVQRYEQLVRDHLSAMASWTGSLFKLEFVICSVMLSVATKGFCKPPDLDDAGDEGEGGEAVGGVGLGEGTGNQDVSKEIEDESQVEGLQGEQDAEQQKREKGQDEGKDAIEMGDDFEGEMEDVPEDEEGDEKDEKDDGEEEEGPDDQIGDLDPLDPSAVDEKLWGDEKGPEGKDDDGKTQDDRSKEAGAESEVVAKEKEGSKKEKERGEKGKEEQQEQGEAQEGDKKQDDAVDEEGDEEGEEEQEGEAQGQGAAMDDFVKDADTLDLPDDLDLGPEDQKSDAGDEDDEMDELEDDAELGDDTRDAGGRESAEPEPMDEDGGDGADAQAQAQAGEDVAEDAEEDQMDEEQGGATAAPDVQPGEQADTDEANPDSMNAEARESAAQNQSTTTTGGAGQSAGKGADANDDEGAAEDQEQAGDVDQQQDEATGVGALKSGPQQGTSTSQESRSTDMQSNPLRSLGDAVQEIRQRFDDILNSAAEDTAPPKLADVSEPSQLEYLRPDDDDQNMQALGPAGAEEAARLQDLKLIDDEADELQDDVAPMDIDEPAAPDTAEPHPSSAALPSQQTAQSLQPGVEDALTQHQLRTPGAANLPDAHMEDATVKAEEDIEEVLPDEIVEAELRRWKADGQQTQDTEHLWRLYESLTHELSYALCEQLRLILEPTQATRLKGDYRTGKRLNMKKIIPYIASEYTKDKIWLRRTRPSQREYQVLIALDDSRSMSESHSVHLAYQTLALVSKALTRLEVGDVGIAKFGEAVEVLHGFDEGPFTDQAGTKVMGAFNFNQRATNVLSLVDTSLKILEEARERRAASSSSAADLWQLEIIISDGICQDHEKLRTVLRKAEEQRVMVVFVVIDSLQSNADAATGTSGGAVQDSIVSMKHASYAVVDGRMELQVNRYLDTFPFEYYVVLRNVEALPEVLAGTLKQFFERVSED
ncbi:hypothetical protein PENSPDRAFT_268056 [Peniophora sp. CONT]|nr:hypothetical protein PENSPDRAFT_268056 [Peniophora sp. CONT]